MIFIMQIGLALGLYFNKKDVGAHTTEVKLLGFDPTLVDKIFLEDSEKKANLVVEKEKDSWVLPGYYRFPASDSKMDRFIKHCPLPAKVKETLVHFFQYKF